MGTFFLIASTVLFFSGLGCLLIVFVSVARRLKDNMTTSVYFRAKRSYKSWVLSISGVILIVLAQGSYWFYGQVGRYIPFDTNLPRAQLSFLYEEYRQPRLVIQTADQNNHNDVQLVPFTSDSIAVGVEVIKWKKVCQVLGLKDCYRINGIYYSSSPDDTIANLNKLPNHQLNGGPSGFLSLAASIGGLFPGDVKLILSPAVEADSRSIYTLEFSGEGVTSSRAFDNQQASSYSH